jgi:hypothetical protein
MGTPKFLVGDRVRVQVFTSTKHGVMTSFKLGTIVEADPIRCVKYDDGTIEKVPWNRVIVHYESTSAL